MISFNRAYDNVAGCEEIAVSAATLSDRLGSINFYCDYGRFKLCSTEIYLYELEYIYRMIGR